MLSALSSIISLEVFSKIGDWAIEIFKIIAGKNEKPEEKDASGPIYVIQTVINPMTHANESQSVILPVLPKENAPKGEPSRSFVLPLPPSRHGSTEPEFGTDEYLTQLLVEIYRNQRSEGEVSFGFGSTDELSSEGDQ